MGCDHSRLTGAAAESVSSDPAQQPPPFPEFTRPAAPSDLRKSSAGRSTDSAQYCITLLAASGATQQVVVHKNALVASLYPDLPDPVVFLSITTNGRELDGASTFYNQQVLPKNIVDVLALLHTAASRLGARVASLQWLFARVQEKAAQVIPLVVHHLSGLPLIIGCLDNAATSLPALRLLLGVASASDTLSREHWTEGCSDLLEALCAARIVPALCHLLVRPRESEAQPAIALLRLLARTQTVRAEVHNNYPDVLKTLVRQLRSAHGDTRSVAALAVHNLAVFNAKHKMAFDAVGVVAPLLEIVTSLHHEHTDSLIAALGAIKVLCTNCQEMQCKFSGAIEHAVRWINTPPVALQLAGAGALWVLTKDLEDQHRELLDGCNDSLNMLAKRSENAKELLQRGRQHKKLAAIFDH